MKIAPIVVSSVLTMLLLSDVLAADPASKAPIARWSPERAFRWYDERPWLVGCNFLPRDCGQRRRNVAGCYLRPRNDRSRTWLGQRAWL